MSDPRKTEYIELSKENYIKEVEMVSEYKPYIDLAVKLYLKD